MDSDKMARAMARWWQEVCVSLGGPRMNVHIHHMIDTNSMRQESLNFALRNESKFVETLIRMQHYFEKIVIML